jgi:hypothetical protein
MAGASQYHFGVELGQCWRKWACGLEWYAVVCALFTSCSCHTEWSQSRVVYHGGSARYTARAHEHVHGLSHTHTHTHYFDDLLFVLF